MKVTGAFVALCIAAGSPEDWLTNLVSLGKKTQGKAAKWLKEGDNKEHATNLKNSLGALISGFVSTDTSSSYIELLTQLQVEVDSAMDDLQQDLQKTLVNVDEDFMRIYLAPKFSVLKTATGHLSQFTKSSRSASDINIFREQMDGIGIYNAWDGIVSCLLRQQPANACLDVWNLVKRPSQEPWLHPGALVQFSSSHYGILASSLAAVCTFDYLETGRDTCETITDAFEKLNNVNDIITSETSKMRDEFWKGMGADVVPDFIDAEVQKQKSRGYDGATAIRDAAGGNIYQHFFLHDMSSFFGFEDYTLAVYKDITGSDKHYTWATGFKYRYCGYNIMYDFSSGTQYGYSASDCIDSNSKTQATCLHNMHDGRVWALNDGSAFWALTRSSGVFFQQYNGGARTASPGYDRDANGPSAYPTFAGNAGNNSTGFEREDEGVEAWALPPPAASQMEGVVMVKRQPSTSKGDPSSVVQHLSDGFATVAAVAAFFPPVGDVVAAVAEVAASICSVLSFLFSFGKPDPVVEQMKKLQDDIMSRIAVAKNTVDEIQDLLRWKSIKDTMSDSEVSIDGLNQYYHKFVQSSSADAEEVFKRQVEDGIAKYINDWYVIADCLSGTTDCTFQGMPAWQILAMHTKNWYTPKQYMQSIQYYMQLLQQGAFAICGYDLVANGNNQECKLLQGWDGKFLAVFRKANDVKEKMRENFWSSMGANTLPTFISEAVTHHANQAHDGAVKIRDEVAQVIEDNFNDHQMVQLLLGWTAWTISVYGDITGSDKHYMWATGFKYRNYGYNIMYDFSSGTQYGYSASDCKDSNSKTQATCLRNMHSAAVWCLNDDTFWAVSHHGSFFQKYSGGARSVTPGYDKDGNRAEFGDDVSVGNGALLAV